MGQGQGLPEDVFESYDHNDMLPRTSMTQAEYFIDSAQYFMNRNDLEASHGFIQNAVKNNEDSGVALEEAADALWLEFWRLSAILPVSYRIYIARAF
jgi:hypothetical protein